MFRCSSNFVCFEGLELAERVMFRHGIRRIEWVELDETYYFLFEFLYEPSNDCIQNCVCFYINKRKRLRFGLDYVNVIPTTVRDYAYTAKYVLGDCAICLEPLLCTQDLAKFAECNHVLHHLCMESFMQMDPVECSTCRAPIYDWDFAIAWAKYFCKRTLCICNECVHPKIRW